METTVEKKSMSHVAFTWLAKLILIPLGAGVLMGTAIAAGDAAIDIFVRHESSVLYIERHRAELTHDFWLFAVVGAVLAITAAFSRDNLKK